MPTFWLIVLQGLAMSLIALVGSVTLFASEQTLARIVHPLIALAAGSLLGGAFFHMLPEAAIGLGAGTALFGWMMLGFSTFFLLEQLIFWHHRRAGPGRAPRPITYLVLLADGLHNFIGGIGVAGAFLIDVRVGLVTWIAAAAHEVPQELGDFAILVHGGFSRRRALLLNFLSGLTYLVGSLLTWGIAGRVDLPAVLAFAAGNFVYIGASDLVPEVARHERFSRNLLHFLVFAFGVVALLAVRIAFE
ncbi:MAG TPA: zinc transporter [Myxococcales bacterium]|jgi:zinc and cadmium transporter|nr:zinc transporter [Myxococcales bacterium]